MCVLVLVLFYFFACFRLIATLGPQRPPNYLISEEQIIVWLCECGHILTGFYSWKDTEGHLIQPLTLQMRKMKRGEIV